MEKYVRLNKTLTGRGLIVPISTIEDPAQLKNYIQADDNFDWYTSLYFYGKEAKEHYEGNNNSIAGYKGPTFSDKLVFDFDAESIEDAKKDSIELLRRLQQDGVNVDASSRIYFSGNKGFHVEIPVSKDFTPTELKTICTNMAKDLKTFDPKVYNTTRLFRLANTRHQETGLYKTELEPIELQQLTIAQIKQKATQKTISDFKPVMVMDLNFINKYNTKTYEKPKSVVVSIDEDTSGIRGMTDIDFDSCPRNKPRCIHALERGIMVPGIGERNALFLRLAAYYRNQGMTKDGVYNNLKSISRLNAGLYPESESFSKEEIWNTVVTSVFANNGAWKTVPGAAGTDADNPLLKRYCDAVDKYSTQKCCLHAETTTDKTTIEISEVFDSFKNFAENLDKNIVKTGINFIDTNMKIVTGTTTLLVGAAGSGKTTASLNILEMAGDLGQQSMFFSMDMHKNLVYLKLAQKLTNYKQDDIFNFHRTGDTKKIKEIKDIIAEKYKMTLFDFSSTLSLDQMRDKVFDAEQKTGNKIKIVITDYASRIDGPHSDTYANARYNALKSKETSDVTDAAWIILSQISRTTGDGGTPIRTKRAAKESGDWEEAATNVITMWRPFMGDHDRDDVVRMYLAKNRMGAELENILHWDGAKGLIRDMSQQELDDYNALRGDKAEKEYLKIKQGRGTL